MNKVILENEELAKARASLRAARARIEASREVLRAARRQRTAVIREADKVIAEARAAVQADAETLNRYTEAVKAAEARAAEAKGDQHQ